MKTIDKLIINSPYEEPKRYWEHVRNTREFVLQEGRRPAGYIVASESSKSFDDPGTFIEIKLVNTIRPRVMKWREDGYPGVTGITKRLLNHWRRVDGGEWVVDSDENNLTTNHTSLTTANEKKFFFCQLEAIETLIWLTEAPEADRTGIEIPGDGGDFSRWCTKMATGSGKTIVMSMLIAWQVLNKVPNQLPGSYQEIFP